MVIWRIVLAYRNQSKLYGTCVKFGRIMAWLLPAINGYLLCKLHRKFNSRIYTLFI